MNNTDLMYRCKLFINDNRYQCNHHNGDVIYDS